MKNTLKYLGVSISIVGVPLGMYLNHYMNTKYWSQLLMFLSIVFIISVKNIIIFKLPSITQNFIFLLFFQLYMLLFGILSNNITAEYIYFHLYVILLILSICTLEIKFDFKRLIQTIFILSSICTILGVYFMQIGQVVGKLAYELKNSNDSYSLEPFTIAYGAIVNFICCLFLETRKKWIKIALYLFLILDLYLIIFTGKRTPLLVCIFIGILFIVKRQIGKPIGLLKVFTIAFILVFFGFLAYLLVPELKLALDNRFENIYYGVLNILGESQVSDSTGSAMQRYVKREWTFNYISDNFNFFTFFHGAGYMTKWIDSPILQSFLDMGLIGLLGYAYFVIMLPISYFIKFNNDFILFSFLLCIYNILSSVNSGNPYLYIKYIPVIICIFSYKLFIVKEKYV